MCTYCVLSFSPPVTFTHLYVHINPIKLLRRRKQYRLFLINHLSKQKLVYMFFYNLSIF